MPDAPRTERPPGGVCEFQVVLKKQNGENMTHQEYYDSKLITLDEALDLIHSGDCIASGHYGDETCRVSADCTPLPTAWKT